jgi:hypothetical protein
MEAKLIKTKVGYHLWLNPETKEQQHIASDCEIVSDNGADLRKYKLSLKNCQVIERGYDLDELVKEQYPIDEPSFKRGFKLSLEVNSDKRFTLEDMIKCFNASIDEGWVRADFYIQSLQQTEWDVEIVMEDSIGIGDKHTPNTKPKLDADGCIILKRKI